MKKIAHISDLHFGREDKSAADALIADIGQITPDAVAVSGDLTQRARRRQYKEAAKFLDRIKFPKIVIPGNHDISLHNFWKRFVRPLRHFKDLITDDFYPEYEDDEMYVLGINSARSLTWKAGRVSLYQINKLDGILKAIPESKLKILAVHHNGIVNVIGRPFSPFLRANLFFNLLNKHKVDLMLTGHVHNAYAVIAAKHHKNAGATVISSAGTAISKRLRGGDNEYNLIEMNSEQMRIAVRSFKDNVFSEKRKYEFHKIDGGWTAKSN